MACRGLPQLLSNALQCSTRVSPSAMLLVPFLGACVARVSLCFLLFSTAPLLPAIHPPNFHRFLPYCFLLPCGLFCHQLHHHHRRHDVFRPLQSHHHSPSAFTSIHFSSAVRETRSIWSPAA